MDTLTVVASAYCLAGLGITFGMWVAYDRRSSQVWLKERRQRVFHCIKCRRNYQARAALRVAPCPDCEFENTYLQF